MKLNYLWISCSVALFALSLVSFKLHIPKRNPPFAAWICFCCSAQLVFAWGLAAGRPRWFWLSGHWSAFISVSLSCMAIAYAVAHYNPVNRIVLEGMGSMLAFDLFILACRGDAQMEGRVRNISFFVPTVYMLFSFFTVIPQAKKHDALSRLIVRPHQAALARAEYVASRLNQWRQS